MTSTPTLAGKRALVTGGSRGIGLAIATRLAADGAKVAIMAKTDQPHPKLPGTIHTRKVGESKKGHNAMYGLYFAKVIGGTWWRERRRRRQAAG